MKKMLAILAVLLMSIVSVAAEDFFSVDSQFVPGVQNLPYTGSRVVDYCVDKVYQDNSRAPFVGVSVSLQQVCRDTNNVFGCQAADLLNPSELTVTVLEPVTGEDGCAAVQLDTDSAMGGTFFIKMNGMVEEAQVTEETGTAYIPEFTAIGAGIALVGAGIIAARRRKE